MRSTADGITQKQECSSSAVLWEGREKWRDWELRVSILWLSYLATSEKIFGLCCVILWLLSTYLKLQLFSSTAFSHSRTRIKNEYGQGLKVAWLCNVQWQKSRYSFWQKDCLPPLHFQRLKSRNNLFCCLQSKNRFCLLSLKLFVTVCTLFWFFCYGDYPFISQMLCYHFQCSDSSWWVQWSSITNSPAARFNTHTLLMPHSMSGLAVLQVV